MTGDQPDTKMCPTSPRALRGLRSGAALGRVLTAMGLMRDDTGFEVTLVA